MQSSLELCAALKMSNTQTQVKWARNPSWINSSDTPNTFNFSCDLFLLAQTALCCTAVHDVESTPVCDYIVLADWYQLEGGGTPLCRIFWTDTLRNFEKRFLSIKFVQLSKKGSFSRCYRAFNYITQSSSNQHGRQVLNIGTLYSMTAGQAPSAEEDCIW